MHKFNSFGNMNEHNGDIIALRKIKKLTKRLATMAKYHQDMVKQESCLKEQLRTSQLFLNMCVHDLKNPTTSISQGL